VTTIHNQPFSPKPHPWRDMRSSNVRNLETMPLMMRHSQRMSFSTATRIVTNLGSNAARRIRSECTTAAQDSDCMRPRRRRSSTQTTYAPLIRGLDLTTSKASILHAVKWHMPQRLVWSLTRTLPPQQNHVVVFVFEDSEPHGSSFSKR
jgi:hypothetical protein